MKKPAVMQVPIPLFEKLVDDQTYVWSDYDISKSYTLDQLRESIRMEVSQILNSRSNTNIYKNVETLSEDLRRSPLFYGTMDLSAVFQAGQFAWHRLAEEFALSISRFETRLQNVEVEILKFDTQTQALDLLIMAEIWVNEIREPITFPVIIEEFAMGSRLTSFKTVV